MIVFSVLFAGLAILGGLIGLGHIGQPMSGQSITSYGWALCIDAAAISMFLAYARIQRALSQPSV